MLGREGPVDRTCGCCRHPQLFKFPGGSSNQSSKLLTYLAELVGVSSFLHPKLCTRAAAPLI